MKPTLRNRLYKYLQTHEGWHAKGNLADLARASALHATGEATGRRLRELHEEGLIDVDIRGKHAWYRLSTKEPVEAIIRRMGIWFDSLPNKKAI